MPNWCSNGLTISHTNDSTWKWFMETQFDFEKINPLIKITEDNYIQMINKYKKDLPSYCITNNFCVGTTNTLWKCPLEQEEFDAESAEDRKKLCESLERDLRCYVLWGTKWTVDMDEKDFLEGWWGDSKNELCLSFQTAWSPPNGIYEKLHIMGFKLSANFMETGCDCVGSFSNLEGELVCEEFCYSDIKDAFNEYWLDNGGGTEEWFKSDRVFFGGGFAKQAIKDGVFNESVSDMVECEYEMWIEDFEEEIKEDEKEEVEEEE